VREALLERLGSSLNKQHTEQAGDRVAGEQQFHDELIG